MDIRCPYCETVYEFDSRHLTPEGVTLKCSTCSKAFRVRAEPELASIFVRQGSAAPQQWPSTETVTEAILAGQLNNRDQVSRDGGRTWQALGDLEEYLPFFRVRAHKQRNAQQPHTTPLPATLGAPRTSQLPAVAEPPPLPHDASSRTGAIDGRTLALQNSGPRQIVQPLRSSPTQQLPQIDPSQLAPGSPAARRAGAPPPTTPGHSPLRSAAPVVATPAPLPVAEPPRPASPPAREPARTEWHLGELGSAKAPAAHVAPRGGGEHWELGDGRLDDSPRQLTRGPSWITRGFWGLLLVAAGVLVGVAIVDPGRLHPDRLWGNREDIADPTALLGATLTGIENSASAPEGSEANADPTPSAAATATLPAGETPRIAVTDAPAEAVATRDDGAAVPSDPTDQAVVGDAAAPTSQAELPELRNAADRQPARGAAPASDSTSYDALMRRANDALRSGQSQLALDLFSQAGERADRAEAHVGSAEAYMQMGRRDLAVLRYERATRLNARYQPAWVGLGVAREAAGDTAGAIEAYSRALAIRNAGTDARRAERALERLQRQGQ